MIRFSCDCGRELQARDEDTGKKAKCPSCGSIVLVSEPEESPARRRREDAPEEEPRSKRRRDEPEEEPSREDRVRRDREERPRRHEEEDDRARGKRKRRTGRDVTQSDKTSGKAVASLICGISSLCLFVPAIPGLILGILALRDISKSDGELGGKGTAITGLVFSCLSFLILAPIALMIALLMPAVQKVRSAATRMEDANNFKQVGVAMHSFHDRMGAFPQAAAFKDANGKPLLSWRVALLPYLGEAGLYQQFKLDEPWDGPSNRLLLALMPKVYEMPQNPNPPAPGMTYYRVFVGRGAAFEPNPARRPAPKLPHLGWGITAFTDGTSNTLLVVTAQTPIEWTRPDELDSDPTVPLPALGGHRPEGFNVLFADGSVRQITSRTVNNPGEMRALITRNGGEPLPLLP